jgi:hypothetical protein
MMFSKTPVLGRTPLRSLLGSAKRTNYNQSAYRCLSCSLRQSQKASDRTEDGGTTHFGFETISESQKEEKGWMNLITDALS